MSAQTPPPAPSPRGLHADPARSGVRAAHATDAPAARRRRAAWAARYYGAGLHSRAPRLRVYGNAIVPQQAAEFVNAYLDCGDPHART